MFVSNEETILDTDTNLIWKAKPEQGKFTWYEAMALGRDGWRLPNIKELLSIVDYKRFNPTIDPIFECKASYFWSSSANASYSDYAWYVGFGSGDSYGGYKSSACSVRLVRDIPT